MKGIKVVRYCEEERYSLFVAPHRTASCIYTPGEWTEPKGGCGPLAVFENITQAKKFVAKQDYCEACDGVEAWECLYKLSDKYCFWLSNMSVIHTTEARYWSEGTRAASRVKLIKRVALFDGEVFA